MKLLFGLLLTLAVFTACRNNPSGAKLPEQPSETMLNAAGLPADFVPFYRQFHRDSVFQMGHIDWPLSGKMANQVDSGTVDLQEIKWTPENWNLQHEVDFSTGEFVQEFEPLGDVMVIERIRTPGSEFSLERRFAKRPDGEWQLIYYRDMYESE
ncbi:MAG: hypothetical protein JNL02_14055 [Saprospiraceae bacterium]|nr:hypothetical protein [Saprospiraceae bacterium]MCC7505757.1 hypothetical protein [Saprospiraceae bacterium]